MKYYLLSIKLTQTMLNVNVKKLKNHKKLQTFNKHMIR